MAQQKYPKPATTRRISVLMLAAVAALLIGPPARADNSTQAHDHGAVSLTAETTPHPTDTPSDAENLMKLQNDWGIELIGPRHTAAGYFLDLRFRVVDPEKAAALLRRQVTRYVIVEKSGAVLRVPSTEKLGLLRSAVATPSMVKRDRIYSALFANPGRHVQPGDKVTVVLGDFKAQHVMVE